MSFSRSSGIGVPEAELKRASLPRCGWRGGANRRRSSGELRTRARRRWGRLGSQEAQLRRDLLAAWFIIGRGGLRPGDRGPLLYTMPI